MLCHFQETCHDIWNFDIAAPPILTTIYKYGTRIDVAVAIKKLGNTIEFRTTFEISYQLKNKNRIGISFSHISNANIGQKNPGVEVLSLSYQKAY